MRGTNIFEYVKIIIILLIAAAALIWFLFTFSYGLLCPECRFICYPIAQIISNLINIFGWKPISVSSFCNFCGYC